VTGLEDLEATPDDQVRRRSNRRRWITLVVVLVVLAALTVALARGWDEVSGYDWQLHPAWLVLGVVLVLVGYAGNGMIYSRSVEWLSPVHPTMRVQVSIWARSLLGRYVPGNVMMVVGRAVMSHDEGVPRRITLAATAYEQIIGLGLGSIGAVIFLARYGDPGEGRLLWLLIAVPLILVFLHPAPFRRISDWALRRVGRPPLDALFDTRQVVRLVGLFACSMVPLIVGIWALVRAAAGPAVGGPLEVGTAFLLAFVISFLAFVVPSGIGIRDGIFALALSRHLPGEVALAVAVGLRFALILIELLFVGLAVMVGRIR